MEKHKHCINCGISIPPEEVFCSEKCREEYMKKRKKALRSQQIFLLMMLAIIAIYVAMIFFK
jgi:predicted nucleic acid-binding Zn ribbon protein